MRTDLVRDEADELTKALQQRSEELMKDMGGISAAARELNQENDTAGRQVAMELIATSFLYLPEWLLGLATSFLYLPELPEWLLGRATSFLYLPEWLLGRATTLFFRFPLWLWGRGFLCFPGMP